MVLVLLIVNIVTVESLEVEEEIKEDEPFPQNNCFSDTTMVWTKNDTSSDVTANQVFAMNLKEGDLVGTLDASSSKTQNYKFMWTRATDVTIYEGNWTAHSFAFQNGQHLTVTSPHLMIIVQSEKSYFIRADQVQVGDLMLVNKKLVKVTSTQNHFIERKVAIETEDGTIQVNGVWASGFCDNNVDTLNRVVKYQTIVDDYKIRHFGEDYNSMCMDEVAWKISYLRNNALSQ